ncbi:hypothetical protein NDU88_004367 [Pleurodeles waltl]|uniref:Uncharacterized protein n=1 Tax=Pleurodeles waltl TaxID=8319 RepID=A0AAV7RFZ3_PLEWA|nr:hypothetical protein NDU88_004367 [Pleurodeles waltl]
MWITKNGVTDLRAPEPDTVYGHSVPDPDSGPAGTTPSVVLSTPAPEDMGRTTAGSHPRGETHEEPRQ